MTFAARETSRTLGQPVDIYLFRWGQGANDYFAYTDAEQPITLGTGSSVITYQPIPIMRAAVNSSGTLDKATLEIRTPTNAALAEKYKLFPPSQIISLVIRQGHIGDPDNQFLAIWTGRVLGSRRAGSEAVYTCDPISTALRRTGLRRHYQYSCPHVLYGPMCRANKDAATKTATIASVSRAVVTMSPGWAAADKKPKYVGGLFEWDSTEGQLESRTIWRVDGDVLILSGPADGVIVGQNVYVVYGCDHTMGDCNELHHNLPNFGGCPWIPKVNPLGLKNNFY